MKGPLLPSQRATLPGLGAPKPTARLARDGGAWDGLRQAALAARPRRHALVSGDAPVPAGDSPPVFAAMTDQLSKDLS